MKTIKIEFRGDSVTHSHCYHKRRETLLWAKTGTFCFFSQDNLLMAPGSEPFYLKYISNSNLLDIFTNLFLHIENLVCSKS